MSKEQILKEFDEIYGENHHKICIGKNCECHKVVKQFLIKAISQTREETIKEIEDILIYLDNNREEHQIINEIKEELNKLKN